MQSKYLFYFTRLFIHRYFLSLESGYPHLEQVLPRL
jgi:hypothetical protein